MGQVRSIIILWERDIQKYEEWRTRFEEVIHFREEAIIEVRILGEEPFGFLQAQHSILGLKIKVSKQPVTALKYNIIAVWYHLDLYKEFIVRVSQVDPFTTETFSPKDYVLSKFGELMESQYQSSRVFDGGKMSKIYKMILWSHESVKIAKEFREGARDIKEKFDIINAWWDSVKDIDEDGIGQILEAFKKKKEK